jgi:2,3-dihydroxy-p-cumate/2,3-dihydroxybenzoate 3,4-dioxygenase
LRLAQQVQINLAAGGAGQVPFLSERRIPIVFGPGRHPTSGARFLYFLGPDKMVFEYSFGVVEIEDDGADRPRQFGFEPSSFCMWASKPAGMRLPEGG